MQFRALTKETWQNFCDLFQKSKECQFCWCMNHFYLPQDEKIGEDAKADMKKRVDEGKVFGVLAFEGEKCVGWCAVDPVVDQIGHDYQSWKNLDDAPGTWSIHCLFIHPGHRGQKISSQLMEAAIEIAKENGAKRVLGFPIPEDKRKLFPEHDGEFSGRFSSFTKLGFQPVDRINDFYQVVQREI